MRTEIRVILAIVSPVLDKPFLSLRFEGGRARSSLHAGFRIRGKGALFFYLLQLGDSYWQQKQRGSGGNLPVLSPSHSPRGTCLFCLLSLAQPPARLREKGILKLLL